MNVSKPIVVAALSLAAVLAAGAAQARDNVDVSIQIRSPNDLKRALRMDNHFNAGIVLTCLRDLLNGKPAMNRAVPLPENYL